MLIFIEYPPCSTCKRAKQWLLKNRAEFESRNIKTDNPDFNEIKSWYKKSGIPLKKFFNTSGVLYRSLNLKERLFSMSENEQLELLASDGMLVKRPILINGDKIVVGFNEQQWRDML
jgi:transcriptional regulator, spx/mgsR family